MADTASDRKKHLYERLRHDILTLVLAPGADLDETRLAGEFGLSRTPLREVLQQLAGEGYVSLYRNRGARVSDFNHKTLRDFFLVAPMVYAAIARLAVQSAKPAQVDALKKAQKDFRASLRSGSVEQRMLANNRFHAVMGEMAGNAYLTPSLDRLLIDHARISMTFYLPRDKDMASNVAKASEQHDQFIEAIENGDEERAAALSVAHWDLSRGQIEKFIVPGGLDATLDQGTLVRTA